MPPSNNKQQKSDSALLMTHAAALSLFIHMIAQDVHQVMPQK